MRQLGATVLIATLLGGAFASNAGATTAPSAPAVNAELRLAAVSPGNPAMSQWQAGKHYRLVPLPQATDSEPGKVEVIEIFWYGCGHCYALDPSLESWAANKPGYIDFARVPVIWGVPHRQHARLFYTLQSLGRPELHTKVFDVIHRGGQMLAARSDAEARALQLAFLKGQGVSEADFNTAYDSPTVAASVQRAAELTEQYAVGGVPLMIVNGKYATSISEAGSESRLLSLINDLAASEQQR